MKKYLSTINKVLPALGILSILLLWQVLSMLEIVPAYMLPGPADVLKAFVLDLPLLVEHARVTLIEAFLGLSIGVVLGFIVALIMENFRISIQGNLSNFDSYSDNSNCSNCTAIGFVVWI